MDHSLRLIGITGGIGTGKSEAGRILRTLGGIVIDSDAVSRDVVQPGQPAFNEIVEHFGAEILDHHGRIDRKKLGAIIFGDESQRLKLNEMTHRYILAEIQKRVETAQAAGQYRFAALEVPVPVREGFLDYVETVWFIKAPRDVRIKRVMARNSTDKAAAEKIIDAQMTDEQYEEIADLIIINDGDVKKLEAEIKNGLADLMSHTD